MKKLILALIFLASFTGLAEAQCNGVFANNSVCGNATGASNLPRPTSPSAFLGAAGGTNGQIQYNNAGALGGRNTSGNGTVVGTTSGTLTNGHCVKIDSTGNLVDAGAACLTSGGAIYVLPSDYGAVCDGVTNDATALQNMLTGSTGKTIYLPPGTCLTNSTLNVPTSTTIIGANRDSAIIKGTMASTPVFLATNVSTVAFSNFTIQGNNATTSWTSGTAGAFQYAQNSSAVADNSDISLTEMRIKDFNSAYWVYFGSQTSTHSVTNVTFSNNVIATASANVPTDANPLFDNNYGFVMFGATAGNGQFIRTRVNNNRLDVGAICFPIIIFANTTQTEILGNQINNPGRTTPAHCVNGFGTSWNTYGIAVYDLNADGHPSTQWIIDGNIINAPYATGIYIVGDISPSLSDCGGCLITNNIIRNQAQQDANPRGAIVVSSTTNVSVVGNIMMEGYGGLVIGGQTNGTVLVEGNNCKSSIPYVSGALRPSCLNLAGSGIAAPTGKVLIYSNNFENTGATSSTVLSNSATGNRYGALDIAFNSIYGTGFDTMDIGSSFSQNGISVRNNSIIGTIGYASITGNFTLLGNTGTALTAATLPTATNGSSVFVSDGTPASSPCTGASTGSTAFRQNGAWKCF